jgi:hypothetical protein
MAMAIPNGEELTRLFASLWQSQPEKASHRGNRWRRPEGFDFARPVGHNGEEQLREPQ